MNAKLIKSLSTQQLISVFIDTSNNNDSFIPEVRGWLMDELETRNPEAFDKWLSLDEPSDEDLYKFY